MKTVSLRSIAFLFLLLASQTILTADPITPSSPGWTLVRRADSVGAWHPATDSLAGTDVYGTPGGSTSNGDFSVNFAAAVPGWDQFLLMTGDETRWMVMAKSVLSTNFDNAPTQIISSYLNASAHSHLMYNRAAFAEDPWLSALDHSVAIGSGDILYGEDGYFGPHAANVLPVRNGANVFIRNSANHAVPEPSTLALVGMGAIGLIGYSRRKRKQAALSQ